MDTYHGGIAQLGERLLCKQEVIGSIPFTSTISCLNSLNSLNEMDVIYTVQVAFCASKQAVCCYTG